MVVETQYDFCLKRTTQICNNKWTGAIFVSLFLFWGISTFCVHVYLRNWLLTCILLETFWNDGVIGNTMLSPFAKSNTMIVPYHSATDTKQQMYHWVTIWYFLFTVYTYTTIVECSDFWKIYLCYRYSKQLRKT